MTVYTIACMYGEDDTLTASAEDGEIIFRGFTNGAHRTDAFAGPETARTFARGILALADQIDGGEGQKEPAPVKVGDLVRITQNGAGDGNDNLHAVGHLSRIDAYDTSLPYLVDLDGADWWCAEVVPVDQPAPTPANSRADYVTQATALLDAYDYTAADVIALARFLSEA